jgi:hypothetical protein
VSLPSIIGTPAVGSEVTANQGGWSGYPSISYTYQWRRDGVNISGATSQAYTIQAADYEADLDVVVSATNTEGGPVTATSPAVTVIGVPPVNTVAPAVSGSSGLGDVLTTTDGTWTGYPASFSYAYQWRRNGNNIGGATSSTYTTPATSVSGGTANNGDVFLCYVSNNAGNVTSAGATLVVNSSAPTAPSGSVIGGPFWNNTLGERWRNQAVTWTWWGGSTQRIGNLTAPPVHGTGTISADGYLTPGVNGEGVLLVSIQRTDATDDDAFYQGF